MPTGTAQLNKARKLLSDAQLHTFFAAASGIAVSAPGMVHEDLTNGQTLDSFFAEYDGPHDPDYGMAVQLVVKRVSPRVFRITFGFEGSHAGDGGTWRVVYPAKGTVQAPELEEFWLH